MGTTIAAISTAQSIGGIGIIRISGNDARKIVSQLFRPSGKKDILTMKGYTAAYGRVFDGDEDIDDAIALVFASPKSYTGEDVVELHCHGGLYNLKKILRTVYKNGAIPAEVGEFTKRALLNGKLSLTKAEAVMDIISAGNEQAARAALSAMDGAIGKRIGNVKNELLNATAHLAAWADYPEDDIPEITSSELEEILTSQEKALNKILAEYDAGRALRQGIDAVIAGKPNAGKSTFMNLLTGFERSIVTNVPGTTRDIVEDTVTVGSIVLHLSDTAGLRETQDTIERIGVERAKEKIDRAAMILAVFDGSSPLDGDDLSLIDSICGRTSIAIINKTDLNSVVDTKIFEDKNIPVVCISALNGDGFDSFKSTLEEIVGVSKLDPSLGILANERQFEAARKALESIEQAITAVKSGMTFDAVTVMIEDSISYLSQLTGEKASEEVINKVFEHFCVGK